jgi:peptidoglycan hydrolase CwlO-like protein
MNYTSQIEKCDNKVNLLQNKIEVLEERLRKSDSTLARAAAKLELINEMGK